MSEALKGALIIGQSGGPSSVINASAYGCIRTALDADCITRVYGAYHGIKGVLNDELLCMDEEDRAELDRLPYTPSSALGSCRYKIKDPDEDDTDYKRILEIFKKYDVRYFCYNGGNDSMDTCNKISKYMKKVGYECRVMGVPKTIDNDLFGTDHCPGYASAAKYIATSIMEVYQDAHVYDTGMIVVVEIMGRHAGWLTAASALAGEYGAGPDLVYLPVVGRRHRELGDRAAAHRADDLARGDILPLADARRAAEIGVRRLVPVVVRDGHERAHHVVVAHRRHNAAARGDHLRADLGGDVDAVVRAPVAKRLVIRELVDRKRRDLLPHERRDHEPRGDGLRVRLALHRGDGVLHARGLIHHGEVLGRLLHRLCRLCRLLRQLRLRHLRRLVLKRQLHLRGNVLRVLVRRIFRQQRPIARDGQRRHTEEQGYV